MPPPAWASTTSSSRPRQLLLWMRSHRDAVFSGNQGHVFTNGRGNKLSRGWLWLKMQRLRLRLGLPPGVTYYGLRHRYGLASLREFTLQACSSELGLEVPGFARATPPWKKEYKAPALDLTSEQCDALTRFVASSPKPQMRPPDSPQQADRTRTQAVCEYWLRGLPSAEARRRGRHL